MTSRPTYCCGKCPELTRGGYDCTCRGNPRCEESGVLLFKAFGRVPRLHKGDGMTNAKTTQAMADVLEGFAIDESGGNIAVNEEEAWAMAKLLIEAGYIHVEDSDQNEAGDDRG